MPITVQERYGRRLSDESAERLYLIRGTTSSTDARSALLNEAPATFDSMPVSDAEVEELEGLDAYLGSVRYAPPDFQPPEEPQFSFDTTGGTQHITQSLATVGIYAPPNQTAPNFGRAIGVTTDSVEGVDITVPVYSFSETHYLPAATVNNAYKGVIFSLTGKVNSGSFRGLAPGECLFLGASGSQRGVGEDWEITFRFAGLPNRTGLTVGNIINISKKGWEYLWVRYQDTEDAAAKMLVKKPIAAYVERVYDEGSFGALGIGS